MDGQESKSPAKLSVRSADVEPLPLPEENVVSGAPETLWNPIWQSEDGTLVNGIWHATPGVFFAEHSNEMFCVVEGHATITPEGGDPIDVRAGDAIFMTAVTRVKWEVHETVRKAFFAHTPDPEA